jgi:hypothetical protein
MPPVLEARRAHDAREARRGYATAARGRHFGSTAPGIAGSPCAANQPLIYEFEIHVRQKKTDEEDA